MTQTSLAELKNRATAPSMPVETTAGFDTAGGLELLQRSAKLFASSNLVPTQYQDNIANCAIACDMALRLGANPLLTMQNLYVVHGRPAWSAQFLIATLNKCGRFSALRYAFQGKEGQDDWGCRAVSTELATGEKLEGPLITIGLAKKEGWYTKNGSKWQSMPELMLRYRAAAWFVRAYAPEIAMGLQTAEEVRETFDLEATEDGSYTVTTDDIKADIAAQPTAEDAAPAQQSAQPAPAAADSFRCPKNDKAVTEADCAKCSSRAGCPAWNEEVF